MDNYPVLNVEVKPGQSIKERTIEALNKAPFFVPKHKVDRSRFPVLAKNMDSALEKQAKPAPAGALSEAERLRLVKEPKSPTLTPSEQYQRDFEIWQAKKNCAARSPISAAQKLELVEYGFLTSRKGDDLTVGDIVDGTVPLVSSIREELPREVNHGGLNMDLESLAKTGEVRRDRVEVRKAGCYTVITHREWSDEWRIRTQVDMCHSVPPEQEGKRETNMLSLRGARAIADSCHYMALEKGGYSTFMTLTLDAEARARVAAEESTVQKEISRFFDSAQKMYQRGWVNELTGNKLEGNSDSLHYCWVVENPKNEQGEDNQHAHILMKWRVPYKEFQGWAERLEKLWGQGFAHLEKIKDPAVAGAYMAKAAGYMTKAEGKADQGVVRGNRYSISKPSRAPDWVFVGRYENGIMGSLIKDTYDFFNYLYGHDFQERRELNEKLESIPKDRSLLRQKLGKRLEKVREDLNKLPAVASKHQIILKGVDAFAQFIDWAKSPEYRPGTDWLPNKEAGAAWSDTEKPDSLYLDEFRRRLIWLKRDRYEGGAAWWSAMMAHYDQVEPVEAYNPGGEDCWIYLCG